MAQFDDETVVTHCGPGRWQGVVSPHWSIGEVPNGGYVLAIALAGVRAAVSQPHPLTVTAHYLRPCHHAPVDVEVEVVREGRTVTTAMTRLVQDGKERLRALAAYGDLGASEGPTLLRDGPPQLPPPEDCLSRFGGADPPGGPSGIVSRVDTRIDPVSAPWITGAPNGTMAYRAWTRLADGRAPDVHCLPLLVDAMMPAVFGAVEHQWVPTVELTVHVRAVPAPGWLRARVSTRFLIDGAFEEDCELWDATDRLVAQSRQLARMLPGDPATEPGVGH